MLFWNILLGNQYLAESGDNEYLRMFALLHQTFSYLLGISFINLKMKILNAN